MFFVEMQRALYWQMGNWYFIRYWVFFHIAGCVHTGQQPQSFCVLKKAEA